MPKDIEDYVEEFREYLTSRSKSICTVNSYTTIIKQLLEFTKKTPDSLTLEDITRFKIHLNTRALQNNDNRILGDNSKISYYYGIRKYLIYISGKYNNSTYDEYRREKVVSGGDDDLLKPPTKTLTEELPLTKAEVSAFLQISEPNLLHYTIVNTQYRLGQRPNQIANLNISDIDWEGTKDDNGKIIHRIWIRHSKQDNTYYIDTEDTGLIKMLKTYIDEEREEPKEGYIEDNYGRRLYHEDAIFLNGYGRRWTTTGINVMNKRYAVKLQTQGKLRKNVRMHSQLWRHTLVTILFEQGLNVKEIMKRTGHRSEDCCLRYCRPRERETISKIDNALSLDDTDNTKPSQEPSKPDDTPKPKPQKPSDVMYHNPYYTLLKDNLITPQQYAELLNNTNSKPTDKPTDTTSMFG